MVTQSYLGRRPVFAPPRPALLMSRNSNNPDRDPLPAVAKRALNPAALPVTETPIFALDLSHSDDGIDVPSPDPR
jgi:hypothetical protein